jgi:hypothetical protein
LSERSKSNPHILQGRQWIVCYAAFLKDKIHGSVLKYSNNFPTEQKDLFFSQKDRTAKSFLAR